MQTRIGRLGDLILVLLALLTTRIVYWQLVRGDLLQPLTAVTVAGAPWIEAPWIGTGVSTSQKNDDTDINRQIVTMLSDGGVPVDLSQLPQPLVQRLRDLLNDITRGTLYDRNGSQLAYDAPLSSTDGNEGADRLYADPSLGHITGYVSGLRIGIAGLERAYNGTLFGLHRLDAQVERILRLPVRGSDLLLTLDLPLQQAAASALQGRRGAIVALDARDGAVLAMVASPGFDPNQMLDPAYTAALDTGCTEANCPAPLLNRATQARYVPGSTWKTVPLIAGLDTGRLKPGMMFDFGKARQGANGIYYVYEVDGGVIPDPNHKENRLTLELSYAKSANAAFARIGDEMGAPTLIDYAHRLGFSADATTRFPFDLPTAAPQVANDPQTLFDNNLLRASTAIGQGELLVTPLSIARMLLPIVNDGALPHPYLVSAVRDPDGRTTPGTNVGKRTSGLMQPETARQVRRMMQIVVEQGSGGKAAVKGLTIGGKTGTAQLGPNQSPHAWFAGYASNGQTTIVMAVLIENGGEGSQAAAPVFAALAPQAVAAASKSPTAPPLPTPIPTATSVSTAGPTPAPATPTPGTAPEQPTAVPGTLPTPQAPTPPPSINVPIQPDILFKEGQTPFYLKSGSSCTLRDTPRAGDGVFTWPTNYQALSGGAFREGHPGADFAAPNGSPVYAADDGTVVFAGWSGNLGYGNVIVIDHGNGFWTLYAHLSTVSVPCGVAVTQAQRIGMSGSTGNSGGAHLHFEVRVTTGYVDPIRVLPTP